MGSTFVSAAFGSVYIYTAELAPTSHRGKIMGICHLGSQIGMFSVILAAPVLS